MARSGKCLYRIKTMAGCGTSLGESSGSKQLLCYNLVCYWWVFLFACLLYHQDKVVQFRLRSEFSYPGANSLNVWDSSPPCKWRWLHSLPSHATVTRYGPPNPCEGSLVNQSHLSSNQLHGNLGACPL